MMNSILAITSTVFGVLFGVIYLVSMILVVTATNHAAKVEHLLFSILFLNLATHCFRTSSEILK